MPRSRLFSIIVILRSDARAPGMQAKAETGRRFKLSDYRGKSGIPRTNFHWSFVMTHPDAWPVAARRLVALVKKLEGKPFALTGGPTSAEAERFPAKSVA